MRLKKVIYIFIIMCLLFVNLVPPVYAADVSANLSGKTIASYYVRKGPGTTYAKAYSGKTTPLNNNVTITKYALTDDKSTGCSSGIWFYVTKMGSTTLNAYVCSTAIKLNSDHSNNKNTANMTDAQFEQYLKNEGFPSSYWDSLKKLHKAHPNWVFKSALTFKDWNSVLNDESELGMSTIYVNSAREKAGYEALLETKYSKYFNWSKNMFYGYDGSFFIANKNAVAYYMDPRNFLTEEKIFMFEGLNYNENSKNSTLVTNILGNSNYTTKIVSAAKEFNVSPTHLASRIKQEGTIGTTATKGQGVTCSGLSYSATGTKFNGPLYNFYNIGATSSPSNAVLNGLCYAAQTDSSTFRPWNTVDKAIRGGAKFIGSGYINVGQYTVYFQKYNTSASASKSLGHQYMTNIEAPSSEASIVYNKYKSNNQLSNDHVFYIPYYLNMPSSNAKLPTMGNPNNWLSSLTVDGTSVSKFSGNTTTYNVEVANNKKSVSVKGVAVAYKTSYVSVAGKNKTLKEQTNTINLTGDTTKVNIVVTAGNGSNKTYTINIIKKGISNATPTVTPAVNNDTSVTVSNLINKSGFKESNGYIRGITLGMTTTTFTNNIKKINSNASIKYTNNANKTKSGNLVTGDNVTINTGNSSKTMTVVVYGDNNGDGKINIKDLLIVQRSILGYTKLTGSYLESSDVNKDGKVNIKDLLIIQKSILGYANISQV